MNKIKVCHMTSVHPPEDVRIFHKECVSLAESGYEVYLVQRGESYEKNGVRIVGVGEIPQGRLKRMTVGAKRVYEKALELDCDLYHFHDPELLPYGLKLKKLGKKVVFDSHELTREQIRRKTYLPSMLAKIASLLYSDYENHVLNTIDGVIFPCLVRGKFPLPGKNTVLLNNVPRLREMYDKYNPLCEKDPDSVCTVGSLTYDRGTKHLIMAGSKAGCKVLLGGKVTPASFEKELISLPESRCAVFLGYLNRDGVTNMLSRSRIGISPLLNVGQYTDIWNLPTKVYEYMAMGLPVILTRRPYHEDLVKEYGFGICVDPENTEEFAAAIRDLLDHPEKADEMGRNGRKAVKESFNWEIEQNNLLNLYRTILEN